LRRFRCKFEEFWPDPRQLTKHKFNLVNSLWKFILSAHSLENLELRGSWRATRLSPLLSMRSDVSFHRDGKSVNYG
jgi:hypothetical protein